MVSRIQIDDQAIDDLATSPEMEAYLLRVAKAGAAGAARRAPVDSGELKASYRGWVENGVGYFGSDADHAEFVEYGTSDTRAQPHLRPAFDDARAEADRD